MLPSWLNRRPSRIAYVSDGSQWSFYWDAHYITAGLRKLTSTDVVETTDPSKLRRSIIQFGDRYAFFSRRAALASSNHVFLTWFHGGRTLPDPAIQKMCAELTSALPQLKGIVVPCTITREALLEMDVPASKISTIPLGVDLERFSPPDAQARVAVRDRLEIPHDAFVVGSFQKDGGGWGEGNEPKMIKGPDIFVETMASLRRSRPNAMVLLTGPARGYVKHHLTRANVPYRHVNLENYWDIVPHYQALDAYAITSRCEGGPKALLESWATGVPVVTTRVGMSADLVRHGENGFLHAIDDVEGMAASLVHLEQNPETRTRVAQNAQRDVQGFSWDNISRKYYELLYRPLLRT